MALFKSIHLNKATY